MKAFLNKQTCLKIDIHQYAQQPSPPLGTESSLKLAFHHKIDPNFSLCIACLMTLFMLSLPLLVKCAGGCLQVLLSLEQEQS